MNTLEKLQLRLSEIRRRNDELDNTLQSEIDNYDFILNKFNNQIIISLTILFGIETSLNLSKIIPLTFSSQVLIFFILIIFFIIILLKFRLDYISDKKNITRRVKKYQKELDNWSLKEKKVISELNKIISK